MKQLSLLVLGMSCILLFSFYPQKDNGIKKINDSLWEISSTNSMSAADQNQFKELFTKEIGVKNFKTEGTVENKYMAKGGCVFEKTIGSNWFDHSFAYMSRTARPTLSDTQKKMVAILEKYTPQQKK